MIRKIIILFGVVLSTNSLAMTDDVIAYLAHSDGFWQVWIMKSDGADAQQVSSSDYDKSRISWYPDARHILISGSQGELFKLDITTGKEVAVTLPIKGSVDAILSPDGKSIAFSLSVKDSVDNNHIWLFDYYSQSLRQLTNNAGLQHEPTWSPDGEWIYYLSGSGDQSHDIWRVNKHTLSTEQLTSNSLYHFDVAVLTDRIFAYSSNRGGEYEIWINDDGVQRQVTNDNVLSARPFWSPDHSRLVYESAKNGVTNISIIDSDGGVSKNLTDHKNGARYPVWFHAGGS